MLFRRRVSTKALIEFTRSLAVMVQARLALIEALDTAAARCRHASLRQVLACVRSDVQRGVSLSDSLARHPAVFNDLYVHLARIGEMAGILDQVLLRLAAYLEKAAALKRKVRFALFYPTLILAVSVVTVVFFLTTIVPTFAEMYADFGQQLPGPTQVVLRVSRALTEHVVVLVAGGASTAAGAVALLRTPQGRLAWDHGMLRLPVVGTLVLHSLAARFSRTLGTLLASGVALVEGLSVLARASGNRYVERSLGQALDRVRQGSNLHQPLQDAGCFPALLIQLVAVGEQTSELDAMLLHAAAHYEQEVDVLLNGLTAIIEPVLIVLIGLLLGGILVSLYLPMFELINTIG